jgi:hypothetical protein
VKELVYQQQGRGPNIWLEKELAQLSRVAIIATTYLGNIQTKRSETSTSSAAADLNDDAGLVVSLVGNTKARGHVQESKPWMPLLLLCVK